MTKHAATWSNLPAEMQALAQWAVSGASKAPMAHGPNGGLRNISVVEPSTWMTFEDARNIAWANRETVTTHLTSGGVHVRQTGLDIGFILNAADPFTCIDLDVKDAETTPNDPSKWTSPDDWARYVSIVQHLDSYTERSKSGKGLHVWCKGNIGRGFRRDGVEVYSQERYIISTGDVWIPKPVSDRSFLLANMVHQMRPVRTDNDPLEELPQVEDDWYILQKAASAANGDKFLQLWKGLWKEMDFPSQSEADLALMSMLCFYSMCNEQCRRLFRDSMLGKREKSVKDNRYLDFTLRTIRGRQAREAGADISGILKTADLMQQLAAEEITAMQGGVGPAQAVPGPFGAMEPRVSHPLQVPGTGEPVLTPPPPQAALAQLAPVTAGAAQAGKDGLSWPPGFVGALAQFIYNNSMLPIKEVSIVSALGLMAGLCGKAWHIPKSGLNLYIVLVARSAIGKEQLHTGISTIVNSCKGRFAQFGNFVDFNEYVSGSALIKACAQNTSFVNISGEWGRRMKRMAAEKESAMETLRTQMTHLYQKSAPASIVGGLGYSAQENNIESLQSVAYSMVGESTPQTFYDALTETMMEDGFLSRFLVIEYTGDRPEENVDIIDYPDNAMVEYLCSIAFQADANIGNMVSQKVERSEEAAQILSEFSKMAANKIRESTDESRRQMWNRATLKVLRVSALLAVGDNYIHPVIEKHHVDWAIEVINADIAIMRKRLEGGDIGMNDAARERLAVGAIKQYLAAPVPKSYKIPDEMRQNGIVSRPYLQMRLSRKSAFYKQPQGANRAIDFTINSLLQQGYIMEVKKEALIDAYSYHGQGYRVLTLPDYEALAKDNDLN